MFNEHLQLVFLYHFINFLVRLSLDFENIGTAIALRHFLLADFVWAVFFQDRHLLEAGVYNLNSHLLR